MDGDDLVWRLAQLASLPYQERYVFGGTKDSYRLSSELIEDITFVWVPLLNGDLSKSIGPNQLSSVRLLLDFIDENVDELLAARSQEDNIHYVRDSFAWHEIRKHAMSALSLIGYHDLNLSADEVRRLSCS